MSSIFSLKNKVALVTGGSSGIGKCIAEVFTQQGAVVYILDIEDTKGEATVQTIRSNGGQAYFRHCDTVNRLQVEQVFSEIHKATNRIDIVVNNAAVAHIGNIESTTDEDLDRIYEINIKGGYHILQAAIPYMKAQNGGVLLNIASVASVTGIQDRFAYSMSKGAVLTMTYSIAKDYLKHNIRCNAIGPARVHTPFVDQYLATHYPGKEKEMYNQLAATQPIGRMGKPEEVAYLALYLCSDEAAFATGSFYPIDGGFIRLNT